MTANYPLLVREALVKQLGIDASKRPLVKQATDMVSASSRTLLRDLVVADPSIIGKTVPVTLLAEANIDSAYKGRSTSGSKRASARSRTSRSPG